MGLFQLPTQMYTDDSFGNYVIDQEILEIIIQPHEKDLPLAGLICTLPSNWAQTDPDNITGTLKLLFEGQFRFFIFDEPP